MIVRSDLPTGFLVAQAVHAAGETGPAPDGTNAVVLSVPGEPELRHVAALLTAKGILHKLIVEPDAPYLGAATAIGIPPGPRQRMLSALPLLRDEFARGYAAGADMALRECAGIDTEEMTGDEVARQLWHFISNNTLHPRWRQRIDHGGVAQRKSTAASQGVVEAGGSSPSALTILLKEARR